MPGGLQPRLRGGRRSSELAPVAGLQLSSGRIWQSKLLMTDEPFKTVSFQGDFNVELSPSMLKNDSSCSGLMLYLVRLRMVVISPQCAILLW